MTTEPVQGLLQQVNELLKSGELEQANRELAGILQQNLENSDVIYALTGVNFWTDKLKKAMTATTAFERGEYLVSQWKPFTQYMEKQGPEREPFLYALKQCVFSLALGFYQSLYREDGTSRDPEIYRKTGLCYKKLGDYERALRAPGDPRGTRRSLCLVRGNQACEGALSGSFFPGSKRN